MKTRLRKRFTVLMTLLVVAAFFIGCGAKVTKQGNGLNKSFANEPDKLEIIFEHRDLLDIETISPNLWEVTRGVEMKYYVKVHTGKIIYEVFNDFFRDNFFISDDTTKDNGDCFYIKMEIADNYCELFDKRKVDKGSSSYKTVEFNISYKISVFDGSRKILDTFHFDKVFKVKKDMITGLGTILFSPFALFSDTDSPLSIKASVMLRGKIEEDTQVFEDLFNKSFLITKYKNKLVQKRSLPASLFVKINYYDKSSFLPNNTIDAAEKSTISATITNGGKGTAFGVQLTAQSENPHISFPSSQPVGDIPPGEGKTVTIPITADLTLSTGTADFLITAREKRGYDSRPVELQVATARLLRPEFAIATCKINDSSGLASGDGDTVPENNEIIELNPFIKNSGEGDGLQVSVKLTGVSSGIEIIKDRDELASVGRAGINKATLAFKVPRTYAQPDIYYTITVTDIRGIKVEKSYTIPFAAQAPVLACSYQVFDKNNREAPGLENGKSYLLKLTPRNIGSNLAESVKVRLNAQTSKVGIGPFESQVGRLRTGSQGTIVTIPFSLDRSYEEPSLDFDLTISQDSFSGLSRKITLPVIISKPRLSYQAVLLNGIGQKSVSQNSHPNFRVSVSNNGSLDATDVTVRFKVARGDIAFDKTERIGTVRAGESQYRDFTFFVRGDAEIGELPIQVKIGHADFAGIDQQLAFRLERETALVQKVSASGDSVAHAGRAVYAAPPQLYVNSPNRNVETYDKVIDLHGSIVTFGAGNAVQEIAILVNGKPLKLIPVTEEIRLGVDRLTKRVEEGNKVVFDGKISLEPEVNEIEIRCSDRNNRENNHIIRVTRKARLGNIYAVVVGISRFVDPSLDLEYAASDARKFYNFLRSEAGGSLAENRVQLLTDAQANRAAIIKALTKFLGKAGPDDTVEIYLATHGVVDAADGILYYLSHNSDIENLLGTAFSTSDFEEIIKYNIRAGKVIIYLDACHSGLSGLSKTMYAQRGVAVLEVNQKINSLAGQLSKSATSVTTFSASSASGYSLEDAKWGGGVFTHHLLKGLRGAANKDHNEWVTISELENYLTRQILIDTDGKQKPKVNGTLVGETPLAKVDN